MKKIAAIFLSFVLVMSVCTPFTYAKSNHSGPKNTSVQNYGDLNSLMQMFKQYYKDAYTRKDILKQIQNLKRKYHMLGLDMNNLESKMVFVNGNELSLDVPPFNKDGRMLIPIRALVTALGADVKWDSSSKVVTITKGNTVIQLKMNSNIVLVNGREVRIDVPAINCKGYIVVPIRFIAEQFGETVEWDEDTGTIIINDNSGNSGNDQTPALVTVNDNQTGTALNQFTYHGSWNYGSQSGAYKNDNHWSSKVNAYYQVTFHGNQVKLYGAIDPRHGIAAVSIDGSAESYVDFYSSVRKDNVLVYTSPVLPNGQHTLKVRVTGSKSQASSGTTVTSDRLEILNNPSTPPNNPSLATVNDNTTGTSLNQFNYQGTWYYGYQTGAYNSDNHWSNQTNAYYQVIFQGNQVNIYGAIDPGHGIAAVSIDGSAETLVDFYSSVRKDNVLVYTSPVLSNGQHTLKVRVTGSKNSASTGTFVNADRVDVLNNVTTPPANPSVVSINDNTAGTAQSQFNYQGAWYYGYQTGAYNSDNHWSNQSNAYYQVVFQGTQANIYNAIDPGYGIAAVSIDGSSETLIDFYSAVRKDNVLLYSSPVLNNGLHTLKVRVTGTKNSNSSGTYINADRVEIINPGQVSQNVQNLALNKTSNASSIFNSSMNSDKAFDGNSNTRWSSLFSDNQWISVDLGSVKTISKVKLNWEAAYGKSYKIQVSSDGTNWSDVYYTTSGDGGIDEINISPINARYVKLVGIQRGTCYGYSLWEFEVY
ncbi:MAG: stalk domain-containing protein [Bacillota bacterium]|nr:stalk domain-containing protein [Bacillota bacterium]